MKDYYRLTANDGAYIEIALVPNTSINGISPVYSKTHYEGWNMWDDLLIGEDALVKDLSRLRNGGFSDL